MDRQDKVRDAELLWLTDNEGHSYLMKRDFIESYKVPDEVRTEVRSLIEDEVEGYGEANWLLRGVLDHMGLKIGDDKFDPTFDLDSDGDTDWDDYHKAKKHWYEQYGDKTTPPATT